MQTDSIYLDYAAASPLDPRVLEAMRPYLTDQFYNPSSPYAPAVMVRRAYDSAKAEIARAIGGHEAELVMTAGATESINLAFQGVEGEIIVSAIEHQAVLDAAARKDCRIIAVAKKTGRIDPENIKNAITDQTEMISIGLANNELGTVQPLRLIAEIVKQVRLERQRQGNRRPIYFHSDASQGVGLLEVNVARLGVDMLTISAAKIYGPKQVGALWASSQTRLSPLLVGGGQERGLRSGTENVAGVVGFAMAINLALKYRHQEMTRLRTLRDKMQHSLVESWPSAIVAGSPKHRLANFLHISFPGIDAERIIFMLEKEQIYVATGSACAANQGARSHVLNAIGFSPSVADGSIRLTLGRDTTAEKVEIACRKINQALQTEYQRIGLPA